MKETRRYLDALVASFVLLTVFCALPCRAARGGDQADSVLEALVARLDGSASAIASALGNYSRLELARRFDDFQRLRIHEGLLGELKKRSDPNLATAAARLLKRPSRANWPAQVLLLKALIGERFPLPKEERIAYLTRMVQGKNFRLSIWGLRLLGDSRWPEAVDALIDILAEEENTGKAATSLLWHFTSMELFRVLGAEAAQGGSGAIRKKWERMGRKIPEEPIYDAAAAAEKSGGTFVFFGDRISPRAVFLIDTSTSMRREATLRRDGSRMPKVEIVKKELERAVSGLQPFCKFTIYSYNANVFHWPRQGLKQLISARSAPIASAVEFARNLQISPGTNIHDALVAGLETPEVETIYLLSDGAPSRGGGPEEIRKRVRAMNYLLGVRIVTYGFGGKGGADENLMKWLAKNNWGWYRRLDK